MDVEHIREIRESTVKKVFSENEQKIAGFSKEGYVRLWTMKEACAKLIGTGLSDILAGLEIIEDKKRIIIQKLNQDIRNPFCYKVIAEGQISDLQDVSYFYSVCADCETNVEIIYTKWENQAIVYR